MEHPTVHLLTDLFDLEKGEAQHILASFARQVIDCLDEVGRCRVIGVGTFVRGSERDVISFEAEDPILRAVNVRFEGLPTRDVVEPVPAVTGRAPLETESAEPVESVSAERTTPVEPDSPGPTTPAEPASPEPLAEPESPRPPQEPTAEEPVAEREGAEDPAAARPPARDRDTARDGEKRPARDRQPAARHGEADHRGSRRFFYYVLPLVLVAVAVVLWMVERGPGSGDEIPAATEVPADGAQPSDPAEADAAASREGVTDAPASEDAETAGDAEVATADQAVAPGNAPSVTDEPAPVESEDGAGNALPETLTRESGGYALIVGSTLDRPSAERRIAAFTELDMPFGVLEYTDGDAVRFRLAVGQFDTAEQADSARQALSDVLPSGTWVWRIR